MEVKNVRVLDLIHSDESTINATSETRPASNLKKSSRGKVWRSSDTSDQTLTGDFITTRFCNSFVLWRHNLSSKSTVRLRLYAGANQTGSVVYDSGSFVPFNTKTLGELLWGVDPLGSSVFTGWVLLFTSHWFDPVGALSWQVDISDPANTDGFIQITRLMIGSYSTVGANVAFGLNLTWVDPSVQERTDAGSVRVLDREAYRKIEFSLDAIRPQERGRFQDMGRYIGKREDVFISVFPEAGGALERDYAIVAKREDDTSLVNNFYDNYTSNFTFIET